MATKEVIKALKISDIKISDITIGTKKTNKTVPILLGDKLLVCQTPFLEIKGNLRKTPYPNIYQMDTLFRGDTKQKIHQWYNFIENIETHISDLVMNTGSKWFTQKNVIIKSLIRELEPDKGIFFIKWPVDLQTNIFVDENKKAFDPSKLHDKDLVKLIIEISNLWIDGNQCGLAVIVQKVLVRPYTEKVESEYIFDDTDSEHELSENENNIISLLATEQKTQPSNAKNSNQPPKKSQTKFSQPNEKSMTEMVDDKNKHDKADVTKKMNTKVTEEIAKQKKIAFDNAQKRIRNTNNVPSVHQRVVAQRAQPVSVIFSKDQFLQKKDNSKHYDPKLLNKNTKELSTRAQKSNVLESFASDDSDNELSINSDKISENYNRNAIKQLVDEYSASSDEINEDDLDFDNE